MPNYGEAKTRPLTQQELQYVRDVNPIAPSLINSLFVLLAEPNSHEVTDQDPDTQDVICWSDKNGYMYYHLTLPVSTL